MNILGPRFLVKQTFAGSVFTFDVKKLQMLELRVDCVLQLQLYTETLRCHTSINTINAGINI